MAEPQKGVRFAEAIDFLKRRLAVSPDTWRTLLREVDAAANDRSAGMGEALVRDITAEMLKAIEGGEGFAGFLTGWNAAVGRHGWTSGDDSDSSGARAELAFRLMSSQAYAAGRWQQIQRLKAARPYLRYVHVDPELLQPYSRPEHAHWHGMILSVDDPWWDIHYPPNGWNCRCYVQSLSERDLKRYGWEVSEEAPADRTVIKFVRGRPMEVTEGIDPGFAVNWGKAGLRLPAADST